MLSQESNLDDTREDQRSRGSDWSEDHQGRGRECWLKRRRDSPHFFPNPIGCHKPLQLLTSLECLIHLSTPTTLGWAFVHSAQIPSPDQLNRLGWWRKRITPRVN